MDFSADVLELYVSYTATLRQSNILWLCLRLNWYSALLEWCMIIYLCVYERVRVRLMASLWVSCTTTTERCSVSNNPLCGADEKGFRRGKTLIGCDAFSHPRSSRFTWISFSALPVVSSLLSSTSPFFQCRSASYEETDRVSNGCLIRNHSYLSGEALPYLDT